MKLRQWRMRTTLMVSLLLVSLGLTAMSLLVVRFRVQRQIRTGLDSDLQHSLATFRNLTTQRNEMLARETALLADLPSLKALMATGDRATIRDGSDEFWRLSGSDFFALTSPEGKLYTHLDRGQPLDDTAVQTQLNSCLQRSPAPCLLFSDSRLYVVTAQRLFFGPTIRASELGFILIGYAVDTRVAQQVSEAAAAEVAFQVGNEIAASTVRPALLPDLLSGRRDPAAMTLDAFEIAPKSTSSGSADPAGQEIPTQWLRLGREDYRTASESMGAAQGIPVRLIVLKSYDRASEYLRQLNRWMAVLGLVAVLLGGLLAISISRTVTRPLERLVEGTRALAQGDFHFSLSKSGAVELQELGSAFEHMRLELETKQAQLIESDRLATIGRMASSVSHDLRHHLSAIYANAEFMSLPRTGKEERVELLAEVQEAVQNMTDLIESLLLFGRTGQTLHRSFQPVVPLIERTLQAIRSHPEARDVVVTLELVHSAIPSASVAKDNSSLDLNHHLDQEQDHDLSHASINAIYAWIDARTLSRAVFNLMLNACQAARQSNACPRVRVLVQDRKDAVTITVEDNGPGISNIIRHTMFQPFVSAGKENGTGLGLTLAQHIAQEHGGEVSFDDSHPGLTRFTIFLERSAWKHLAPDLPADAASENPEQAKLKNDLPIATTSPLGSTYDSTGDAI